MLRSGFEPESSARKAEMIGRATLPEQHKIAKERYTFPKLASLWGRTLQCVKKGKNALP